MPTVDMKNTLRILGCVVAVFAFVSATALPSALAQDKVQLTVTVVPSGKGQVQLDPVQPPDGYAPGTVVTMTAVDSDPCYEFTQWSGDASGTNPVTTITMDDDKNVEALFGPAIFDVSVTTLSQFIITGSPPAAKTLEISSTGGSCFTWSLEPTDPWIFIDPSDRSGSGDATVSVSINSSLVPCQGTHVGFIKLISANTDPEITYIPVRLRVGNEEVTASVSGSPTALSCQPFSPDIITVTVTNESASEIVFANPPDLGPGFVIKNPNIFPLTLEDISQAPNNTAEIFIRFEPEEDQVGLIERQVEMVANECGREVYFELTATRISPVATIDMTELNFGVINNCESDPLPERTIEVFNRHSENARLWYTLPDGIRLVSGPTAIAGNSTVDIVVEPEREGPMIIEGEIIIEVDFDVCSETLRVVIDGRRLSPSFYAETVQGSNDFTPVEFDTTCLGDTDEKSVYIVNDGNSPLSFSVTIPNDDYFSALENNFTLQPGETKELVLMFSPEIGGTFSSELIISADQCGLEANTTIIGRTFNDVLLSSDVSPNSITLANCEAEGEFTVTIENTDTEAAIFADAPELPQGFEWDETISYPVTILPGEVFTASVFFRPPTGVEGVFADSVNWFGEPCGTRVSFYLEAERILPTFVVGPTDIDLGMILKCEESEDLPEGTFTFENTSTIDMTVQLNSTPTEVEVLDGADAFPMGGVVVAGGESLTLTVRAIDGATGEFTEELLFDILAGENGACDNSFTITVTGERFAPGFEVVEENDGDADFDDLCIGDFQTRRFIVRNTGNIQIEVTSDGFSSTDFDLIPAPYSVILNPDEERFFEVRFSPTVRGDLMDALQFTENLCNSTQTMEFSGRGVEPSFEVTEITPPMPINIIECQEDSDRMIAVTLTNTGDDDVEIRDVFLPEGFELGATESLPISLPAGMTYDLMVEFTATEIGTYTGTAVIYSSTCELEVEFELRGTISSSLYTVSEGSFDFGDIRTCEDGSVVAPDLNNLTQTIEITNTGTTSMSVNATLTFPHPNVVITSPPQIPFSLAPGATKFITVELEPPFNTTSVSTSLQIVTSADTICDTEPTELPISATIGQLAYEFTVDSIRLVEVLSSDTVKIWAYVRNLGSTDIDLGYSLDGDPNFFLDGATGGSIEPLSVDSICVMFLPFQVGHYETNLIARESLCNTMQELPIEVHILQQAIVLMGNDVPGDELTLTSRPGDMVMIPVYLEEDLEIDPTQFPFQIDDITLSFDFNFEFYDIEPMSVSPVSVVDAVLDPSNGIDGVRRIHLIGDEFQAGLLAEIEAEVLLGTGSSTEYHFSDAEFDPLVAFVELDPNVNGRINIRPRNGFTQRSDLGIPTIIGTHPNPASSSSGLGATVEYATIEDGHVELRLYNQLGIEVATLQQGWIEAGTHTARINTMDLPHGVYHIMMITGDHRSSQKIILGR